MGGISGLSGSADSGDPATITSQFTAATKDRPAVLMITTQIIPGWHVYSITQPAGGPQKATIEVTPSPQFRLLGPFGSYPEPTKHIDQVAWPGLEMQEHENQVTWYAPIELAAGVDLASFEIRGTVRMQVCKDSCVPINTQFTARLGTGVPIGPISVQPSVLASTSGPSAAASPAYQAEGSEVKLVGHIEPSTIQPGGTANLILTATPSVGWHIYAWAARDDGHGSKPTLITLTPQPGITIGEPTTDAAINTDNSVPEFGEMRFHDGSVTWKIPITVPATAAAGVREISGLIGYQACETRGDNMGTCELPKGARFKATLNVGGTGAAAVAPVTFSPATYKETAVASSAAPSGNRQSQIPPASSTASTSLILILAAALLGGLILNLMPCVLPVIGLKVLAFAEQGGESRRHVLMLNLAYSAGLISVFLVLATLASLAQLGLGSTEFGWGELYTLLWFKVAMICLVFSMAPELPRHLGNSNPRFRRHRHRHSPRHARRLPRRRLQRHLHNDPRHSLQRPVPRPRLRLHHRPAAVAHVHHLSIRRPRHGSPLSPDRRRAVARPLAPAPGRMDGHLQTTDGLLALGHRRLPLLDDRPTVFHSHARARRRDLVRLLVDRPRPAHRIRQRSPRLLDWRHRHRNARRLARVPPPRAQRVRAPLATLFACGPRPTPRPGQDRHGRFHRRLVPHLQDKPQALA